MEEYINHLNGVLDNVRQQLDAAQREEEEENVEYDFIGYNRELYNMGENGIKTLTKFSVLQIEEVYEECQEALEAHGRGRRTILTNKDKLFYLLIYMHTNDIWAKLSMILHISANYLNEVGQQSSHDNCRPTNSTICPFEKRYYIGCNTFSELSGCNCCS